MVSCNQLVLLFICSSYLVGMEFYLTTLFSFGANNGNPRYVVPILDSLFLEVYKGNSEDLKSTLKF